MDLSCENGRLMARPLRSRGRSRGSRSSGRAAGRRSWRRSRGRAPSAARRRRRASWRSSAAWRTWPGRRRPPPRSPCSSTSSRRRWPAPRPPPRARGQCCSGQRFQHHWQARGAGQGAHHLQRLRLLEGHARLQHAHGGAAHGQPAAGLQGVRRVSCLPPRRRPARLQGGRVQRGHLPRIRPSEGQRLAVAGAPPQGRLLHVHGLRVARLPGPAELADCACGRLLRQGQEPGEDHGH
mmetsp:Transcript_29995/g.90299  ORF Transcript_29995/g.90299 Transcript_29995/m.90299 type:complete len:237 (-) Transcript_29995:393-1103(-)